MGTGGRIGAVVPVVTLTAHITRELSMSFTPAELAIAGGLQAAKAAVVVECIQTGTVIEQDVETSISGEQG